MNWEEFCMKWEEFLTNWAEFSMIWEGFYTYWEDFFPKRETQLCNWCLPAIQTNYGIWWVEKYFGEELLANWEEFWAKGEEF